MKNSGQICKQPEDLYRDRQENLVLPPDTPMKKGECGTSSCEKKASACKVTRKCKQRENFPQTNDSVSFFAPSDVENELQGD